MFFSAVKLWYWEYKNGQEKKKFFNIDLECSLTTERNYLWGMLLL